jgi:hypothetical protein
MLYQPKLNLTDSLPISQYHRDFLLPYDALRLEFVGVVPNQRAACKRSHQSSLRKFRFMREPELVEPKTLDHPPSALARRSWPCHRSARRNARPEDLRQPPTKADTRLSPRSRPCAASYSKPRARRRRFARKFANWPVAARVDPGFGGRGSGPSRSGTWGGGAVGRSGGDHRSGGWRTGGSL